MLDLKGGQDVLHGEGHGIDDGKSRGFGHGLEAFGAGGSIGKHGQAAVIRGGHEGGLDALFHNRVALLHALRGPRGATAERVDVLGHAEAHAGALGEGHKGIGSADARARRAEHGVDAGRNVDGNGLARRADMLTQTRAQLAALAQLRLVLGHDVLAHQGTCDIGDLLYQASRQDVDAGQSCRCHRGHRRPRLRRPSPHGTGNFLLGAGALGAQLLHELAGVDAHGAGGNAHGVDRTGVDALVLVGLGELLGILFAAFGAGLGHGAAHDDALARSHGEVARRTDRLAVAALDATVDVDFDLMVELDVADVGLRVIVDDDARVHGAARVSGALKFQVDVVEFVTVLAAHIRCHGAAGAVLGLEVAAGGEDEVDHALVEVVVAAQRLVAFETVREQEVDIAVLGVAENDGVVVAVLFEQLLERLTRRRKIRNWHHDVLEQRRRAGLTSAGDGGIEAVAEGPRYRAVHAVLGELRWCAQRQLTQERRARVLEAA